MHLGILIGLILLNGIFAMAEIALLSVRKAKLKKLAEAGDSRAEIALALNEEPTRFLSTVQIGITAIGLLNGIVGEAALSKPLASILQSFFPISSSLAAGISTTLVVVIITYVSIVLGELVPKRIAQIYADSIARFIARPIKMIAFFSRPLVFLLTISTETILRILGMKRKERLLTEEDTNQLYLSPVLKALNIYQNNPNSWNSLIKNCLNRDSRWNFSILENYNKIYKDLN